MLAGMAHVESCGRALGFTAIKQALLKISGAALCSGLFVVSCLSCHGSKVFPTGQAVFEQVESLVAAPLLFVKHAPPSLRAT